MDLPVAGRIIFVTWGAMLALYALGRGYAQRRWIRQGLLVQLPAMARAEVPASAWYSRGGTLWVFVINIFTCIWLIIAWSAPQAATQLARATLALPDWVHWLGGGCVIALEIWGLAAMLCNPTYTPLYKPLRREFILATRGPYAVMRHPRYAAEAALNVALFLFTGVWLPLLGLLGWWGMARQAAAEEQSLLAAVGEPYREYCRKTGMFWPVLTQSRQDVRIS